MNQSLLKLIKTRLEGAKGIWPDKLPSVLWAYRTTTWTPTGETPFKLMFGTKAVILAEVGLTSFRVDHYNEENNDKELHLNLDLLDKERMCAEQRLAQYQNLMAKHYNRRVKARHFNIGELVLRRVTLTTRDSAQGKLASKWEGQYKVVDCFKRGTYHQETLDRQKLPHPWNNEHLREYCQ